MFFQQIYASLGVEVKLFDAPQKVFVNKVLPAVLGSQPSGVNGEIGLQQRKRHCSMQEPGDEPPSEHNFGTYIWMRAISDLTWRCRVTQVLELH